MRAANCNQTPPYLKAGLERAILRTDRCLFCPGILCVKGREASLTVIGAIRKGMGSPGLLRKRHIDKLPSFPGGPAGKVSHLSLEIPGMAGGEVSPW